MNKTLSGDSRGVGSFDIKTWIQLQSISENLDSSISVFKLKDNEERPVYVNSKFCQLTGMQSVASYDKKIWLDAISKTDQDKIEKAVFESLQTGKTVEVLFQYKSKDAVLWVNKRLRALYQDEPNTILILSITNDVTQNENARLKKIEEMKQQIFATYQQETVSNNYDTHMICQGFVNLTKNIVERYFFFKQGRLLPFTASYEHNFNLVAQTIAVNKEKEEFFALFNRQNLLDRFKKGAFDTEFTYTRKAIDAGLYWTKIHVHTTRSAKDSDIIAYVSATDVSDQFLESLIVKRLVEIQFDYVAIIDIVNKQIFMRNIKADANSTNPRLTADYQQDCQFAVEKVVAPEDKKRTLKNMELSNIIEQLEENGTYAYAFSVIAPDGQRYRKELHYSYLNEEKRCILMSRMDITKQYLEEQARRNELQRALEQARQSDQAKENFFSQLSHDIRTPMNGVLGVAELAQGCGNITQYEKALVDIKISGKFMMSLLNDVLDISKISARKFELHIEPYLYSDFEKDIKAIILPRAQENQIQLEFKCQEFSTGCALFDKMRLQQIFINLLSNAVKYNKQGGKVEMTTEYKTKKTGQGYFEFHVRDNGIGMSEEFIKKSLFHEFEQENVRSGDGGGTGLGLAIVKRLVIKMDGTISCKSVEGQGTDFMLCIPSKVVEAPEKHSSIAVSYDMSSFAGKRILLCEDRPLNIKIAKLMLQRVGIIVDAAENGKIGVDLFSNSQPGYYDAILMDIRMPVMNGINATMAIRSLHRPDAKSIPIIAISANAFLEDMEQAKASGMNGYIVKPIEPKNLYGTLAEQLIKK